MVDEQSKGLLVIYAVDGNDRPHYGYNAINDGETVMIYCDQPLNDIFPRDTTIGMVKKSIDEVFDNLYDFNEYISGRIIYKENGYPEYVSVNIGRIMMFSEPDSDKPYFGRVEAIEGRQVQLHCTKDIALSYPYNYDDVHIWKDADDLYRCMGDFKEGIKRRNRKRRNNK